MNYYPTNGSNEASVINREFLSNCATEFLHHLKYEGGKSHHTIRAYKNDLNFLFSTWSKLEASKKYPVSLRAAVNETLAKLTSMGSHRNTTARKVACLRSFERYLSSKEINIKLNLHNIRLSPRKLPIVVSSKDIKILLNFKIKNPSDKELYSLRDQAIVELLYATGVLSSELVNITLADIDMDKKEISIKGKSPRTVFFGKYAQRKILKYLKTDRNDSQSPAMPLFTTYTDNNKMTLRYLSNIFTLLVKNLGLKGELSARILRHSFAHLLIQNGMDLRLVQILLGHADIKNTEHYKRIDMRGLIFAIKEYHPMNDYHHLIKPTAYQNANKFKVQ